MAAPPGRRAGHGEGPAKMTASPIGGRLRYRFSNRRALGYSLTRRG